MFVDLNPDTEKIIYSHFTCATGNLHLSLANPLLPPIVVPSCRAYLCSRLIPSPHGWISKSTNKHFPSFCCLFVFTPQSLRSGALELNHIGGRLLILIVCLRISLKLLSLWVAAVCIFLLLTSTYPGETTNPNPTKAFVYSVFVTMSQRMALHFMLRSWITCQCWNFVLLYIGFQDFRLEWPLLFSVLNKRWEMYVVVLPCVVRQVS